MDYFANSANWLLVFSMCPTVGVGISIPLYGGADKYLMMWNSLKLKLNRHLNKKLYWNWRTDCHSNQYHNKHELELEHDKRGDFIRFFFRPKRFTSIRIWEGWVCLLYVKPLLLQHLQNHMPKGNKGNRPERKFEAQEKEKPAAPRV
jgi:hypothetical protein